jgi:aspartyl protease family protein
MLKKVILIGVCIGASASIPILYQADPDAVHRLIRGDAEPAADPVRVMSVAPPEPRAAPPSGRSVALDAGPSGHFLGTFRINGRKVDAMIDTGASAVAINLSTARRLGIAIRASDMKNTVDTANGTARATVTTLHRIEIGRVSIENVPAIVLEDSSLSTTLVGMTFLNRLKAYKVENGRLVLTQ